MSARTKQTAIKETGGTAPRHQLASKISKRWSEPKANIRHLSKPVSTDIDDNLSASPIYWKPMNSTKEYLIIVPDKGWTESTQYITKYDTQEDKYDTKAAFPDDYEPFVNSGHFIDTNDDKLYNVP